MVLTKSRSHTVGMSNILPNILTTKGFLEPVKLGERSRSNKLNLLYPFVLAAAESL